MSKKTAIIGASDDPSRYAYLAAQRLLANGHDIIPISIHNGKVQGISFLDLKEKQRVDGIDTITMYINPVHQKEWEDYLLSLQPKRIIFNPGTENRSLEEKAQAKGIETLHACTLVMLGSGQY